MTVVATSTTQNAACPGELVIDQRSGDGKTRAGAPDRVTGVVYVIK